MAPEENPEVPGSSAERSVRKYRHRGPRRAGGGTTRSQGEPERLAGFVADDGAQRPGGSSASARGSRKDSDVAGRAPVEGREPLDERGRWILEQRPPHWG